MTYITDTLIEQMVQAIVAEVDPEQVILFGSRGRGDEREDSNVDLMSWKPSRSVRGAVAAKRWSGSITR